MIISTKKICCTLVAVYFFAIQSVLPAFSFNIGEEREVGEKLLYSVRSSFDLIDDPDITEYITRIGESVLGVAGIQYFDYHFFVIDSKEFNAFAAPSGLIFFYSGLIESMNSEDEFVSVIAHEIGHIVKRHLASRLEKSKYSTMATLGLALAAVAFGGAAAPALLTGALATGQSITLHFSRENEEEADLLAYGWMKKLHRDTDGQARMLQSMRRIARYRSDVLPQYLLTHPNPEARLDTIESLIQVDKSTYLPDTSSIDDFDFLRFKYRVLAQSTTSLSFRARMASLLANEKTPDLQRDMANYGMAQLARSENNFDYARSLLDQVIEKYPQKLNLLVDKGVLEYEAGEYPLAERLLLESLGENKNDMYATYTLGLLLQRTGRLDAAIQKFEVIEDVLPQYANVYFSLGQIYSHQKRGGLASLYLGKFNLYEGKLDLATHNFRIALKDKSLSEKEKEEAKLFLERIKELKK
ncbi:MAG: putative Zn-dependent protease [Desulforhopalus sp.]|jgi:predicted Zn-dependent protease